MDDLEFDVGRSLGAVSFYICQVLKHSSNLSIRDLALETGLSEKSVKEHLKNLHYFNVVEREETFLVKSRGYVYRLNDKQNWNLH